MENVNPWKHLSKTSGCGNIKSFTVMGGVQSVRYWVREEVEAVKTSIEELRFEREVDCWTKDEEVRTLCTVLALAQQWRISSRLFLPREMSVESWSELSKVVRKGTVDKFGEICCKTDEEVKAACSWAHAEMEDLESSSAKQQGGCQRRRGGDCLCEQVGVESGQ